MPEEPLKEDTVHVSALEQLKVKGKLPSELLSTVFEALSASKEEVKKLEDENIRLLRDLEGEEQVYFLNEAITRSQDKVKKLKDVNMKLLKAPKRRVASIDIGQRKESFFSKSSAAVGKETASTSDETSSDVQTPQLVESGPSKFSSQSSLQKLKTGVSKGEPLKEKDRVNSSDPGLNVTAEVGKSTPQSSCSIPEEQKEPAPSSENRFSDVQTPQLAESGLSKPSSQRSRQKLKTKVSKGIDQGSRYECEICPRTFTRAWNFKQHQRFHAGVKSFQCPTCKNNFSSSSNLKTHILSHTGEKPYECPVCKIKYTRKNRLIEHQKAHTKVTQ
ncbi:zinc finger protein 235-like [Artemia franciscana]|uniref:zinc finger protein 235-like n=1 Tax=Artemia franciscana TaxID=6661 RepID=UPI0032DADA9B